MPFIPDRVALTDLEPLLRRCVVQLRGWDLPHIDAKSPIRRKSDHVEQDSSWNNHIEHWEFYRSGQLGDATSIRSDWLDHSSLHTAPDGWQWGQSLPILDTIITLTEIFELAARLALTPAGDRQMEILLSYRGMGSRRLEVDDPRSAPLFQEYRYDGDRIDIKGAFSREQLAAEAWDLAAQRAVDLFGHFGWAPAMEVIRGSQDELRGQVRRSQ